MTEFDDLVDRYIAVWNETDVGKRRELIARTFTEGTHFVDPLQEGEGQAGINTLVDGVQQKFPDHRFRRAGAVDACRDHIRFRWELTPANGEAFIEGTDFAQIVEGRMHRVTGFFDRLPG
jgi:hypothetical protein